MNTFKITLAIGACATTLSAAPVPAQANSGDAVSRFLDAFVSDLRSAARGDFRVRRDDDDDDGFRGGRDDDDDDGYRGGRNDDDDDDDGGRGNDDDD